MGECRVGQGSGRSPGLLPVMPEQQANFIHEIFKQQSHTPGDESTIMANKALGRMVNALRQSGEYGSRVFEKLRGRDTNAYDALCNATVKTDGTIEFQQQASK